MKLHFFLFSLLACSMLIGCNSEQNKQIVISGSLEGVEDGAVIQLIKIEGRGSSTFLTDTVVDGKFQFAFTDSTNLQPWKMQLFSSSEGFPSTWLDVWVTPGVMVKINGEDKLIKSWNIESDIPEQKELNIYKAEAKEYERNLQLAFLDLTLLYTEMEETSEKTEVRKKVDSIYNALSLISQQIMEVELKLLEENKTYSQIWLEKLNSHSSVLRYEKVPEKMVDKMKYLYESAPEEQQNSDMGQSIYLSLNPPIVVKDGDDMADTDMWDTEGNLHRLADYNGKYLLLDFWASFCGPCIASIPEIREISEQYKDRLVVVGICSDPKDLWQRTSKEKDITWVNLNDFKGEDGIKLRYGVTGIPHYVMVSPEGKMITSWTGYGKGSLKAKMEKLIQ